jgi:hypothetical protein
MSDYMILCNIWAFSAMTGMLVLTILILRLFIGIFKKRTSLVKSSIKYIINCLTFLFVAIVCFSFAIVVRTEKGVSREDSIDLLKTWIKSESFEWFLWALLSTFILTIFNIVYQLKVEKIKNLKQIVALSTIDLSIMCYGIFIGGQIAFHGLMLEINYFTY